MKTSLPADHGLIDTIVDALVFRTPEGLPSLTDVQYDALESGVGRGQSILVASPTSTGKTHIALWAAASALSRSQPVVYLVTHRALARQKFEEFKRQMVDRFLDGDPSALVLATGDEIYDATGEIRSDPLAARLLVATYEKYLGLLCGAGLPKSLTSTVVVCDEIQLVGDQSRGRDVEILLTLLRNAGCRQMIGLSAVLTSKAAHALSDWLGLHLVKRDSREMQLEYEFWTPDGIFVARTDLLAAEPERRALPGLTSLDVSSLILHVLRDGPASCPIIVFCMRKADTHAFAERLMALRISEPSAGDPEQLALLFDQLPETTANVMLQKAIRSRIAIHSADLTEPERLIVETKLADGELDVVFATSTLAAGVNFPLGTAIFSDWRRWDSEKRDHAPIDVGEFHNMAGRVGRLGFNHDRGRVIYFAADRKQVNVASRYLALDNVTDLLPRIEPDRFNQVALQLAASKLCGSRQEIEAVVCGTLSARAEESANISGLNSWRASLSAAINWLIAEGLLAETEDGRIFPTTLGKAVAQSGLLPETGLNLVETLARYAPTLSSLLPSQAAPGDMDRIARSVFAACYRSPEYRPGHGRRPTRFLPWPLDKTLVAREDDFAPFVSSGDLYADSSPYNAAELAVQWISGEGLWNLERSCPDLSAGMLRDSFRDLAWILNGAAAIATAASDPRVPAPARARVLAGMDAAVESLRTLPRIIRRLATRVDEGLPDDALWLVRAQQLDPSFQLSRTEIMMLRGAGFISPEALSRGSSDADAVRYGAFSKARPTPQAKSNWLRNTCREWKARQRQAACERQIRLAKGCPDLALIPQIHAAVGTEFEKCFESALGTLGIKFKRLDDRTTTGAPDYLVELSNCPPLVVELKSKEGTNLVGYNSAVEVLAASEVHGYKHAFCVTVCHPGVDPSVAPVIAACGRLSVVETADLGDALLRLCRRHLTQEELWQWLANPGQALSADMFYSNSSKASGVRTD